MQAVLRVTWPQIDRMLQMAQPSILITGTNFDHAESGLIVGLRRSLFGGPCHQ